MDSITCTASPSLALVKYWGKKKDNLPATSSLAVTLAELETKTTVAVSDIDSIKIHGEEQEISRFEPFLNNVRKAIKKDLYFNISSFNSFPTAAGLASSSSGIAAMTLGCVRAAGSELPLEKLSELARLGSISASRAVFGGFVLLSEGRRSARQVYDASYWPSFRILVAIVDEKPKEISSRQAMLMSREFSPYYPAWVKSSRTLVKEACKALDDRNIEALGRAARLSYMRMHAAMMAGDPPVRYWLPASLTVQDVCSDLRKQGIGAWETMDAGPQVKVLCLADDVARIRESIQERLPHIRILESSPGSGVRLSDNPGEKE
jgi:diphosphomevalonate decarboxylase